MQHQILLIDPFEQHRQVFARFIRQSWPEVLLCEHDPLQAGPPDAATPWADYDLLLIDNQLGKQDALTWLQQFQGNADFPPFIMLCSIKEPDSTEAAELMARAMSLGARACLFKKGLQFTELNENIAAALDEPNNLEEEVIVMSSEPEPAYHAQQGSTAGDQAGQADEEGDHETDMHNTLFEIEQARALLHGHDDWPFPITDYMAGTASFAGYRISAYLGQHEGVCRFRANAAADARPVVLYLFNAELTAAGEIPEPLQQYLQARKDLIHPGLVQCLDYALIDDRLIMIEEAIEGETLAHRLRRRGVTQQEAADLFLQLLSALQQLHDRGLQAGQLSTSHLIIRNDGHLVLNSIHLQLPSGSGTQQAPLIQTHSDALYGSPEALQGRRSDARSDLYVAGTIFFEMLSGRHPFPLNTVDAVRDAHLNTQPPSLGNGKHPMNQVVQGLMAKNPVSRFQKAAEARVLVEKYHASLQQAEQASASAAI